MIILYYYVKKKRYHRNLWLTLAYPVVSYCKVMGNHLRILKPGHSHSITIILKRKLNFLFIPCLEQMSSFMTLKIPNLWPRWISQMVIWKTQSETPMISHWLFLSSHQEFVIYQDTFWIIRESAAFRKLIEFVLVPVLNAFVHAYLDYIIGTSSLFNRHPEHLKLIFQFL